QKTQISTHKMGMGEVKGIMDTIIITHGDASTAHQAKTILPHIIPRSLTIQPPTLHRQLSLRNPQSHPKPLALPATLRSSSSNPFSRFNKTDKILAEFPTKLCLNSSRSQDL